jgi:hypothetical protein
MLQAEARIISDNNFKPSFEILNKTITDQESLIASLRKEVHELRNRGRPPSNMAYEYLTNLQYKVKTLAAQVSSFESGEKYVKIKADYESRLAGKDREIKRLKRELANAQRQVIGVRNMWMRVNDDLEKEHADVLSKKDWKIGALEKQTLNLRTMLNEERDKFRRKARELYHVKTELEDEKGKNLKLTSQINRNHENSSTSSSLIPNRKKIANNREKTGKKPGAQFGHKAHLRKKHAPTNTIDIPAPEKYANSPDYKSTGKMISKQFVDIRIEIVVDEYRTPEFRNVRTGQRVHAEFPDGLVNEVTYSGNVKSFAFLLNNRYNVSIANVSEFLAELTGGELQISTGMINGLAKELSLKTEADQKKDFADLLLAPVMNVDFTTARVNGKNKSVTVCATPSTVIYTAKEHKGHEGVKGTPAEDSQQTFVHDHDKTFYNYGGAHQECLDHVLRHLKDSMENEPKLKWNQRMRELIRETIHFRKSLDPDDDRDPDEIDPDKVAEFEKKYDEILNAAKDEYEYEPPSKYYKKGFNLYKKMLRYRDNHLLFLHDRRVPHSNSLAERLLRVLKRKQHQVMTFRSFEGLAYLCQSLGVIASLRSRGKNLYNSVSSIFSMSKKSTENATT